MSLIASPAGSVTDRASALLCQFHRLQTASQFLSLVKCCRHLTSWNWIEGELTPSVNWFPTTSWCCSAVQLGYALSASICSSTGNSTSGSIEIATPAHFQGHKSLLQTVPYLLIISWTQEPKLAHCSERFILQQWKQSSVQESGLLCIQLEVHKMGDGHIFERPRYCKWFLSHTKPKIPVSGQSGIGTSTLQLIFTKFELYYYRKQR